MEPVPRIATFGWLMIGVSNSAPKEPMLVMVKVEPDALGRCRRYVRPPRSPIAFARPAMPRSFFDGNQQTLGGVSTAIAMFSEPWGDLFCSLRS